MKSFLKFFSAFIVVIVTAVSFAGLPLPLPDDPNEPPPPPPPNERYYSLGSVQLDRFAESHKTFSLKNGQNRLTRLRLIGFRNNINVKSVRLYSTNPNGVRELWELEGTLGASQMLEVPLNGVQVSRIEIIATPSFFWKKPGGYRLEAAALK